MSVREIQKKACVPRQEIYRILSVLEDFGLVEKTVNRPLRFRGIPLKNGVSFLVKQRINETKKMQKKARKLIETFHNKNSSSSPTELPDFVLISKNHAVITKRREEIDKSQIEIDFISSLKIFRRAVYLLAENAKRALERDVTIRIILEKPENVNQIPDQIKELQKYSKYQLRFIDKPPEAIVAIFDKKRAMIMTSASVDLTEAPTLWTDNPCCLSVFSDYFKLIWIRAKKKVDFEASPSATLN